MTRCVRMALVIFVLVCFNTAFAQVPVSVCSWNLKDLGKSKSEATIEFIANTVKEFDVLAIQEVVAGYGGPQAIGRLVDALNRKGDKWDYSISDPTSGSAYKSERYAFIWKTKKLQKMGDAWLEQNYRLEIDREPYFATFKVKDSQVFTLVNFHAITQARQPETEIKYFKFLPALYPKLDLVFCGDFNAPQSHNVFNPLKAMGYQAAFTNQKTSLRKRCVQNDCLASAFDNFFFKTARLVFLKSGAIHFYKSFSSMEKAGKISDHIPIYLIFQ